MQTSEWSAPSRASSQSVPATAEPAL